MSIGVEEAPFRRHSLALDHNKKLNQREARRVRLLVCEAEWRFVFEDQAERSTAAMIMCMEPEREGDWGQV